MSDDADSLFARGCMLRDEERLKEAKLAFFACLRVAPEDNGRLRSAAYTQLAYIEDLLADATQSERVRANHRAAVVDYARLGTEANPRAELPSLKLYICLLELGRVKQALEEAIRFLQIRASDEYRAMIMPRHAEDRDPDIAPLLQTARELIERWG